jgi:hypothetical protein
MRRILTALGFFIVIFAAAFYFSGAFKGASEKYLQLRQTVYAGAFGFALEYVRCHESISAIPAEQRRGYPLEKLHGEICFGAVRLTGPLRQIPPLIIGNLYVGKFVFPSLTNVPDKKDATESEGYANVIINMVFAIPDENVPTEVKMGVLNQLNGRRLFSVRYTLPLTDTEPK